MVHGAGMKGRDLVIVQVGGDIGLRRARRVDLLDVAPIQALLLQPTAVRIEITADGGHDQRLFVQQP